MDIIGNFSLSLLLPFIESACRNKAASVLQQTAEHRFLSKCFCLCIDRVHRLFRVRHPVRDEPPLHHDHFDLPVLYNHRHHLGRSDIEVGPDAECRVMDPEAFAEIIDEDERIPAAHGNV